MAISAAQLPRVRDDLVKLCARPGFIGSLIASHAVHGGYSELPYPEVTMKPSVVEALRAYETRLTNWARAATLYHVTAEMTAVANEARRTMPGYRLHPEDLPADHGLIVFDAPIAHFQPEKADLEHLPDIDRKLITTLGAENVMPVMCIAALWGLALGRDQRPGVSVVFWADNSEVADYHEREGTFDPKVIASMRSAGALNYNDEGFLPFGDRYDPNGEPNQYVRHEAIATLLTTWLMMAQPIVTAEPEPLPRQIRRGLQRDGREVPDVHVVRLRMPQRPRREQDEGDGSGRQYKHRWFVEGHWHRYWYASLGRHKPRYVPTYLKGPEGAPLLNTEKVFDLRR